MHGPEPRQDDKKCFHSPADGSEKDSMAVFPLGKLHHVEPAVNFTSLSSSLSDDSIPWLVGSEALYFQFLLQIKGLWRVLKYEIHFNFPKLAGVS